MSPLEGSRSKEPIGGTLTGLIEASKSIRVAIKSLPQHSCPIPEPEKSPFLGSRDVPCTDMNPAAARDCPGAFLVITYLFQAGKEGLPGGRKRVGTSDHSGECGGEISHRCPCVSLYFLGLLAGTQAGWTRSTIKRPLNNGDDCLVPGFPEAEGRSGPLAFVF